MRSLLDKESRHSRQSPFGIDPFIAICCVSVAIVLLCTASSSLAQGAGPQWASEYQLKAAFIYNVIPFIDWPENALGSQFIIGFAGEGPMAVALTSFFKDKRIASRPVEVRDVRTRAELRGCNLVLMAYPDQSRAREALLQLQGTNVLTIGDGENFARLGGVVAFVPQENTFRLAINPRAAGRAHIKISSKLLAMTKLVADEEVEASEP
jgi:hypothetical protein